MSPLYTNSYKIWRQAVIGLPVIFKPIRTKFVRLLYKRGQIFALRPSILRRKKYEIGGSADLSSDQYFKLGDL